jgi:hypothetical protein
MIGHGVHVLGVVGIAGMYIVCLQETNLSAVTLAFEMEMLSADFDSYFLLAIDTRGGGDRGIG